MSIYTTTVNRGGKPSLKVSNSKKIAKDFAHTKEVMNYFISSSYFIDEASNHTQADRDLYALYDAYNNRLDESYFNYVTNPLNSSNKNYTNFPAKLRPYSIIRPNIDLLDGEFEKRPFNFTVVVNNADAVNNYQDKEYKAILAAVEQQFINFLNESGDVDTGQDSQEVELPQNIKKHYASNYKDKRAEMGQSALDMIIDDIYLEEAFKEIFKDWLIVGEAYSYKGSERGDVEYERVSPIDLDYDKSPGITYIEDASWAVRRMYLTTSDIVDRFYDELKGSELDFIEESEGNITFRSNYFNSSANSYTEQEDIRRNKVEVYHVCFKYRTKIGLLTFPDEFGETQSIEVEEGYKVDKENGESVEWYWVNEVWEGYRISDKFFVRIRPIPNQRNKMNNSSKCKLPYNGRRFSDLHSKNISLVEIGMPYEILYRILHYNLEKTIAKSKGKIAVMDKNSIPHKDGWDPEKFFYWSEANGFALLDRNQVGADRSWSGYSVLDLGMYDQIANMIQVMEHIKREWDEVVGITRQRKGQVSASETASGVNAARYQSAVISERVFSKFEEFQQKELAGLLDLSKISWLEGKKRLFYDNDMRAKVIEIDPELFTESDFGVHVSKSNKDIEDLNLIKQQVQAFAQNGSTPSTIVDVIRSTSISRLSNILKEKEAEMLEQNEKAAQQEEQKEQKALAIQQQFKAVELEFQEKLVNLEYDRKEDLEIIKMSGMDENDNAIADASEAIKVQSKLEEIRAKSSKLNADIRQKDRELDLKDKEIQSKEKIEKLKSETQLKNKTVGEK